MKAKVSGKVVVGSIVAAALSIAMSPLMAQADDAQSAEIANLKTQIYQCHHHHRVHHVTHISTSQSKIIERQSVQPVVIEKIVEKQVMVPGEKEVILEKPMELNQKVVVEHASHRKHLFHVGIPFIGVTLF